MQTLRKKSSPLKCKTVTSKFLGDGLTFKAKLIGILEVSQARGDRMCQDALSDLKMAIRAAGEHKQRIVINIAIDGLRLRDEKTGDSLYHHPVHKISFICQDMTDSRAFGYIFGSPDTGHRFFGIKTDKAANQVVIAMRDLFQVVFSLKKKEVEMAKQHLDKNRYANSPLFSDTTKESVKSSLGDSKVTSSETKSRTAVADLVDLELELNSLQQGLHQMEKITPSDHFGSKDDPFGDSFISYTKPILPPPPSSGRERSSRGSDTSGSIFSPKNLGITETSSNEALLGSKTKKEFNFSREFNSSSQEETANNDWFTNNNSLFEEKPSKDDKHEIAKREIMSQFDVFTELDPLGTGRSRPYIDKKHFFQELKNPPKKVLNDLVTQNQDQTVIYQKITNDFTSDPFGEDPFVTENPFAEADFTKQDPFETEFGNDFNKYGSKLNDLYKKIENTTKDSKLMHLHENPSLDMSSKSECAPEPPPRPTTHLMQIKPPPLPPKKQNDIAIKPPPRPPHTEVSHYDYMDNYETAPSSMEFLKSEKTPPIPVPSRKTKFESDFVPERPKKAQFSDEDYLTPVTKGLLPPPQKNKKTPTTVASLLENKSNVSNVSVDKFEGLDITLSQLTLSGLNELATKLNIPANQLSNMTLVQLTSYLSNFIKAKSNDTELNENKEEVPSEFKADFAANFSNNVNTSSNCNTYDRYAVFRELIKEEIKQTKIDTEPEEIKQMEQEINKMECEVNEKTDRYAALREIVENELKPNVEEKNDVKEAEEITLKEGVEVTNMINKENNKFDEDNNKDDKSNFIIEYNNTNVDSKMEIIKTTSPKLNQIKSPIPSAITEIIQNNARLTSGSLSDVVSGSSPEVDNTASNSEIIGKKESEETAETWAIFDQANILVETKEKAVPSEEAMSPWSSDSKDNGSPSDWRRGDSGSDQWPSKNRARREEGWWDTSAEPETQYYPPNRRSTDSFEDEYYECYERPRRRKTYSHSGQTMAAGGHSSSSRDVSPWEEKPKRTRPQSQSGWSRHSRQRHHTDSWDEEEDDYEERRFHRHGRDDRWEEWNDERRHRRRRDERWCCPDWEQTEHEKPVRYGSGRWTHNPEAMWRERKHDDRYYSKRDSQESPWEDDYSNEAEELHASHYVAATTKRNWKRPSSASEIDRKTGEIKSRHYLGPGGSDGERDRRYKPNRRSRSRDSQYSEPPVHRHKPLVDTVAPQNRNLHRPSTGSSIVKHSNKTQFDSDLSESSKKTDVKISSTMIRKKIKDQSVKIEEIGTFPRKSKSKQFDGFVDKSNFEEFEVSETESYKAKERKDLLDEFKQRISFKETKLSPRFQTKSRSLFEDDFSPSEKLMEQLPTEDNSISSIKEEVDPEEEEDSFGTNNNFETTNNRKKTLNKHRLSTSMLKDVNIKKSESVNIFATENDPFDDDFFCGNTDKNVIDEEETTIKKTSDLKWSNDFDIDKRK